MLDQALLANPNVTAFHPCRNDKSVCIVPKRLQEWIVSLGYKPLVVDFAAEAAAAGARPGC